MTRFASALSEHPLSAHAVGEAAGRILEELGDRPDVLLVFATAQHAPAMEGTAAALRELLHPRVLAGASAVSVVGAGREVEDRPGLSLWAASGVSAAPWPDDPPFEPSALVLLADPFGFDAGAAFERLAATHPGVPVLGGFASSGSQPGGNVLVQDDAVLTTGSAGVWLGPEVAAEPVVSQGCRPIGRPLTVTRGDGNIIEELAGQPALTRLLQAAEELSEDEVGLVNRGGLHLGFVVDERVLDPGRGDFLVRNVLGASRERGVIAVGERVEVGQTVQFHLRDVASASVDLDEALAARAPADAALLFTCTGRGRRLFGHPDHDAVAIDDHVHPRAVAGMFAAGEFGPVGGRPFVHGFTASILLLRDRPGRVALDDDPRGTA